MVTIEQLFRQAQQAGAAEIYLMAGRKPAARIGGKIKNLDYPELSSTEAEKILLEMLDAKQAAQYRETKSVDEVIAFHGIGRFRVHIYQNDGVPSACVKIINKKEKLPEEVKALAGITQGRGWYLSVESRTAERVPHSRHWQNRCLQDVLCIL